MDFLKEIESIVNTVLPPETEVTKIDMEGPEVAIYTRNPKAFFDNESFVAKLAFELKKRVHIRTDKTLLQEPEEAKKKILEIVPEGAEIKEITFNPAFSEVVIESIKPGLVIGKGGETSKRITLETGWTPDIVRAPTSPSEILKGIRHHLSKNSAERKKILQTVSKKIYREIEPKPDSWIRLTALGAFQEVGRSCILLETPATKILLDCGLNVASNESPYPYLDSLNFPLTDIDAVIISHAHSDHAGFLPYLFRMGYNGPVYCTLPTRDLMTLLQFDYIDVAVKEGKEPIYTEKDVKEMLKYCITREYREVTDIAPDIRMTFHNAAHILGSASVHLHIGAGQHNLIYTADIKYGFTRLFNNIDLNYPRLETLIIESTYGKKEDIQPERYISEQRLVQIVRETAQQGGNVLIPVFAVGRAQEIMLTLEDAFRRGALEGVKIYIDGMTREASAIHTAYPEYLRRGVQRRILQNDSPFTGSMFNIVQAKDRDTILSEGGNIILASSGMLTGGASLNYFYKMAEDPRNTLIFVGYQGEGSLGRKLQNDIKEIPITGENGKAHGLKINLRIENIEAFSVPYETELLVKRNGEFELTKIGKIADEHLPKKAEGIAELNSFLVPSFDENGKIELRPAQYIIKHKTTAPHLQIKTKSGRMIQASKGHSVFTLKNGEIQAVPTGELQKGDFVVIPRMLPESHTLTEIALADFISNPNYQMAGGILRPKKGGNQSSFLKAQCRDMKSLARFLGYYIAEGHIHYGKCNKPTLSFSHLEKETLVKDAIQCIQNSFGVTPSIQKPHPTEIQVEINNSALAEFLEKIGVGKGAKNKRVPSLVFNLSPENQKEFLKGYFAGDGYHYKNGSKGYLAAKTASKQLVSDLSYLLLQQGIISRIKGPYIEKERKLNGQTIKESTAYKIYFAEKKFEKIPHPIGYVPFALPIQEIGLKELIPFIQDPKMKGSASGYVSNHKTKGRKQIGLEALKQMFPEEIRKKNPALKTLQKFLENDLAADEIIEIKETMQPEFEYDLSVPKTENFVGGFGGICLHNSGHCDRMQLTGYIRNLKPKPRQILVNHGNKAKTIEFAKFVTQKFHIPSQAPHNLDSIRLK